MINETYWSGEMKESKNSGRRNATIVLEMLSRATKILGRSPCIFNKYLYSRGQ
jgi:hypothetical protein